MTGPTRNQPSALVGLYRKQDELIAAMQAENRATREVLNAVLFALRELAEPAAPSDQLFYSVKQVASLIGFSEDWVYRHKEELGVVHIGGGKRPRLNFPAAAIHALAEEQKRATAPPTPRRPGRPRKRSTAGLLEVKSYDSSKRTAP